MEDVAKSVLCMIMSGPFLTGYTQVIISLMINVITFFFFFFLKSKRRVLENEGPPDYLFYLTDMDLCCRL